MPDRLTARAAIAAVATEFEEFVDSGVADHDTDGDGPLSWAGYADSRARAATRTGEEESVVHGLASVGGRSCVLVSFEFGFLGGSLGQRTGDLLEAAYEAARTRGLPLVSLIATGGSRMQEGMVALTQLQRVARASARLRAAGPAQLAVLRDPTTGGGWATLGAGADVILALPGAQVGFAGSRVRPADADPHAYTAEGQLAAGQIDAVVTPDELPEAVARWLQALHAPGSPAPGPAPVPDALSATGLPVTGWDAVRQARSPPGRAPRRIWTRISTTGSRSAATAAVVRIRGCAAVSGGATAGRSRTSPSAEPRPARPATARRPG